MLALTACSGDDGGGGGEDEPTPEEVLAAAKTTLDETSGLTIALSTPGLPEGVQGVAGASGVVTNAPAFEGDIDGRARRHRVHRPGRSPSTAWSGRSCR